MLAAGSDEPPGRFHVPVFFVYTGMRIKVDTPADPMVVVVARGVSVAAIAGKIVAGAAAGAVNRRVVDGAHVAPVLARLLRSQGLPTAASAPKS